MWLVDIAAIAFDIAELDQQNLVDEAIYRWYP